MLHWQGQRCSDRRDPTRFPHNVSPLAFLDYEEERIFDRIAALVRLAAARRHRPQLHQLPVERLRQRSAQTQMSYHLYVLELAHVVLERHLTQVEALTWVRRRRIHGWWSW